jgi:hypothetical protein
LEEQWTKDRKFPARAAPYQIVGGAGSPYQIVGHDGRGGMYVQAQQPPQVGAFPLFTAPSQRSAPVQSRPAQGSVPFFHLPATIMPAMHPAAAPAPVPYYGPPGNAATPGYIPQPTQQGPYNPYSNGYIPPGPQVAPAGTQNVYRQIAPLPATTVAAGGVANAVIQPQRGFRLERLVLESSVSPSNTTVTNITVGAEPQFISAGNVPLSVFAFNAINTSLRGDTAVPGITITVSLANSGGAPEIITGTFLGPSVN